MRHLKHFQATRYGSLLCLRVVGEQLVRPEDVAAWEDELRNVVHDVHPATLLLELSCVQRCSKEAIAALLQIQRLTEAQGGQLSLCGLTPRVAETLRVLKLAGTVFTVHRSIDQALPAVLDASLPSE